MTDRRPEHIKFSGRILFLTDDTALIRQQLEASGEEAATLETELASRLSAGVLPPICSLSDVKSLTCVLTIAGGNEGRGDFRDGRRAA